MANERSKTCATCVYCAHCSIFMVAREQHIQNVQPDQFGCAWHTTEQEYEQAMASMRPARRPANRT